MGLPMQKSTREKTTRRKRESKNALESYAFNLKSSLENDNVKNKISEADRSKVCDKCKEVLDWLDSNQMAEKDEFEHQRKELEDLATPIVKNLYANGPTANSNNASAGGPTVEEVD